MTPEQARQVLDRLDALGNEPEALPVLEGFEIRRVRGMGASGVVYEAEQASPRRLVAVKVLRFDVDSARARQRFEIEADLLARLEHPGIARLYGSGVAQLDGVGRPVIVMELVEGDWITRRLDGRPLGSRLALFLDVCDAMAYAHRRGVMHRDLKPANVIVDDAGRARIVDFGVGRSLGDDGVTEPGQAVGTLAFMSPEQARGEVERVDARADVYALGALLFAMLAERPLHDLEGLSRSQAVERICRGAAISLRDLRGARREDLETIIAKACATDAVERYQTVDALAADVRRHLAHEPIDARRIGRVGRAARAMRRHPVPVGAAAAIVLTLASATGVSAWQAYERGMAMEALAKSELAERRARRSAEEARARAETAQSAAENRASVARAALDALTMALDSSARVVEARAKADPDARVTMSHESTRDGDLVSGAGLDRLRVSSNDPNALFAMMAADEHAMTQQELTVLMRGLRMASEMQGWGVGAPELELGAWEGPPDPSVYEAMQSLSTLLGAQGDTAGALRLAHLTRSLQHRDGLCVEGTSSLIERLEAR